MSKLRENYGKIANNPRRPTSGFFRRDGNAGVNDLRVDGGITPVDFYFAVAAPFILNVFEIFVVLSVPNPSALNDYGDMGELTNGTDFFTVFNGNKSSLVNSGIYKSTRDFPTFFTDIKTLNFGNAAQAAGGDYYIQTFKQDLSNYSDGIILKGHLGDQIGVTINDDLTGLTFHKAGFHGSFVPNNYS